MRPAGGHPGRELDFVPGDPLLACLRRCRRHRWILRTQHPVGGGSGKPRRSVDQYQISVHLRASASNPLRGGWGRLPTFNSGGGTSNFQLTDSSSPQPWPGGSSRGRGLAYGCLLVAVSRVGAVNGCDNVNFQLSAGRAGGCRTFDSRLSTFDSFGRGHGHGCGLGAGGRNANCQRPTANCQLSDQLTTPDSPRFRSAKSSTRSYSS